MSCFFCCWKVRSPVYYIYYGFGKINLPELLRDPAALLRPSPAEMPFANHASVVALVVKQLRQRDAFVRDERALPLPHDAALESTAPIVPPRQQPVPRRRTHAGRRMCVHKTHPLARQPVNRRRLQAQLRIESGNRINPHIIAEDDDDVRFLRCGGGGEGWIRH